MRSSNDLKRKTIKSFYLELIGTRYKWAQWIKMGAIDWLEQMEMS